MQHCHCTLYIFHGLQRALCSESHKATEKFGGRENLKRTHGCCNSFTPTDTQKVELTTF